MREWISRHWRQVVGRVTALVHGRRVDQDVREEIRLHLDLETADLMQSRGLAPAEARRQALVAFGGVDRYHEAHRDARGVRWMEEAMLDFRYAARSLRRTPGFTLAAVAVLALGIGATTTVFSAVNAVLVSRLPYPRGDQLVRIYEQNSPTNRWTLSVVDLLALEAERRTFDAVGAAQIRSAPVAADGEPRSMQIALVTSGFFQAFGVRPARGRLIDSSDNLAGAAPVVVVSHEFATQAFGNDANADGKSVSIDGRPYAVIGVLAAGRQQLGSVRADVWPAMSLATPSRRGPFGLYAVGRLADGVSLDGARRNLGALSARIFPVWQSSFQDKAAALTPVLLRESIVGNAGATLGIFSAAVGLILLIAIANVASLMLVRATGRQRELSLRTVLGATRVRLVRLLVTESVLLAMTGAAAGLAVGALGLRLLQATGPYIPRLAEARLDWRAAAFATGMALVAGIVVGAYPVLSLFSAGGGDAGGGSRTIGAGRRTQFVRGAFVVAEFALALPLLAGAGLLMTSFVRLQRVTPGFEPSRVATIAVSLPSVRYTGNAPIASYWSRVSSALLAIPGVTQAGLGDALPPDARGNNENNFDLVDHPVSGGAAQPTAPWQTVSSGFFATLGVPVLDGRVFEPTDTGVSPVVVVSRSWAAHYFPGEDAVGRQLIAGGCTSCPHTTIVGVVADVKFSGLRGSSDAVYSPVTEGWIRNMHVLVRTSTTSESQLRLIRERVQAIDRDVSLSDATPMTEAVYDSVAEPRHLMTLLGGFAAAALALAAVGIFGMLSYMVTARRREIGVRMALGARAQSVVGMMVRRGMSHAATGAVVGLVVTLAGTRLLAGELYGVSAVDPTTLAEVTLLLLGVASLACWLPARRAARVDPAEAIRTD